MKVKTVLICKILILLETIAIVAGLIYYFVCIKDKPTYSPELVTYLLNNGSKNLDVDYDKYDLFVSGEWHATQKNFDVQMSIIKNLSENSDLKYIIAEDSMGNAMCINNYLHTGDISKLDVVFESLKGTFAGNNESYEFYKKLYEFNKNLPENKKITYLGMDIEHQTNISVGCLWDIALRNSISEKLEKFVQDINKNKDSDELISSLETVYNDANNNPEFYSDKLGNELWVFKYLLRNTLSTYKCSKVRKENGTEWSKLREHTMIENFHEIYNHFPKGKYYGQWGEEHCYLSNVKTSAHPESEPRLAGALNSKEDSPVKNRVYSMDIVYLDSLEMNINGGDPILLDVDSSNNYNEMDSLKLLGQDYIQFFKLDSENSPFLKKLFFFENVTKAGVTTDYFKNIIVVKNSPACTLYSK